MTFLTRTELQVENLKFFPSQFLPPFLGLGLLQDLEDKTRPVEPRDKLPDMEIFDEYSENIW